MNNIPIGPTAKTVAIEAAPAKAFFVDMITRDIELKDAILDLLDNCVDGVRRSRNGLKNSEKPYEGYYANVTLKKNQFSIVDNCGGIPLDIAKKYAFTMGTTKMEVKEGMIGVYGIGMKRAIFKMGTECTVHSHTPDNTFEVKIDNQWLKDDQNWQLEANFTNSDLADYGTRITITDLRQSVKSNFTKGSMFLLEFNKIIQNAFSLLLEKGFVVKVNGEQIKPKLPTLMWNKSALQERNFKGEYIRPYIYKATIENVKVFLAVGFREKPTTSDPEQLEAEPNFKSEDAGWTIICNDRAVLSYDKSSQTGWGWGGVPSYHTQFIQISGFVIFEGPPLDLPMTTTKRGVDANSPLYTMVRERMQEGLKKFTDFTNKWKGKDTSDFFQDTASLNLPEIHHKATNQLFKLEKLPYKKDQFQATPQLPKPSNNSTTARITFNKSKEEINQVASYLDLNDNAPSKIGEASFDFVLNKSKEL